MDHYADDLATVFEAPNLRDATLVGLSTGVLAGGESWRHARAVAAQLGVREPLGQHSNGSPRR